MDHGKKMGEDDDLIRKTPNGFVFMKQNIRNVFKAHKAQSMRNSRK